jgi:hypothetical protein
MPQIINLSPIGEVLPGDSLPIFDESNGDTRRVSVDQLETYMQNNLDMPDNSDEVNFLQAGTGAVTRTVQAKLRETVSVKDFGAVGDNVTDDTAAIQAAIAYCVATGKDLFFPAGDYLYDSNDVTYTIDLIAANKQGFKMYGENHTSKIFCKGNGVIFNVNCSTLDPVAPFWLENLYFQHTDFATDTNSTLFYVYRKPTPGGAAYWGARMHAFSCYFRRFTNTGVHGIMLTNSSFRDCYFYGINSPDFSTYSDAGVRLWGGEGTTSTGATLSNLVEFDTCSFRLVRYGAQIISGINITFKNSTFDPCWCSITAYGPETSNVFGTQNSIVSINGCWFEDQMPTYTTVWYITNRRISFPTGADDGTSISTMVTGERNFFSVAAYVKPSCQLISYANTVRAELQGGGSNIVAGRNFFEAQARNISGGVNLTYYEFGADRASFISPVVVGNSQPRLVGTVGATAVYSLIEVEHNTAAAGGSVVRNNSASSTGPFFTLARTRGSSNGAVTIVQSGDYLGRFDFVGADGVDLYSVGASITAVVDGTPGSNDMPGRLGFWTTPDGSDASVERVRVNSTGSVRFIGLAADPASPVAGDVYYNSTTNKLRCFDGTIWNDLF